MTDEGKYVEYYCRKRPLIKPCTTLLLFTIWLARLLAISIIIYLSLLFIFIRLKWDGIIPPISILYIFEGLVIARCKKLLIMFVELYQHYAPEHIRRRCVCMPTCSEYAILALKKYSVPKALTKIYHRLSKGCLGQFHIDYP